LRADAALEIALVRLGTGFFMHAGPLDPGVTVAGHPSMDQGKRPRNRRALVEEMVSGTFLPNVVMDASGTAMQILDLLFNASTRI
jgi:hypothetical protein